MLTVGNSAAVVEELLGNGLLSCPGCGGRLGGWGHAVRAAGLHGGAGPGGGAAAAGAVRLVRGDACSSSGVAAGAAVRRDGGDRGHARAGGAGAGVPVDRGGVGGAGGHGAGPAAPVPRLGGAGAGVLHPAGRGAGGRIRCRWTRRAASWAMRWWRSPRRRPRRRAGGRRSRCRAGSWRRRSRRGRFCPRRRPRLSPAFAGTCCSVCPGVTVQREFALCPGTVLPVTLGGPAMAGARERTGRDDCGRGG